MLRFTLLLAALAMALPAGANVITVNTAGDNGCSLTAAIKNANAGNAGQPACAPGSAGMDVVQFDPQLWASCCLPVALGVASNTAVTSPITIDGPGVALVSIGGLRFESGASGSQIDDVRLGRVVSTGADLTLTRVRILNGSAQFETYGGGISMTDGNLAVTDGEISRNIVFDAFNVYPHYGGGVSFRLATAITRTLTLTNVTLANNSAGGGNPGATAPASGGGLAVETVVGATAVVNLHHVTVAGNGAITSGGGIYLTGAGTITANLRHVVVGDNKAPAGADIFDNDSPNTALTLERCVIETAAGFTADSSTGSLVGVDPVLTALGCNGQLQRTIALQPSSPAIDFVPAAACTLVTDQRGSPRPIDGDGDSVADCDAGALEDQGPGDFLSSYHTVTPCRVVDTRGAPGVPYGPPSFSFPSFDTRVFEVEGRCGVPGQATALAVNVTVANATRGGELYFHDIDMSAGTSVEFLKFRIGPPRANNGVLPVCTDMGLRVEARTSFEYQGNYDGSVDLILDIVGYFQ